MYSHAMHVGSTHLLLAAIVWALPRTNTAVDRSHLELVSESEFGGEPSLRDRSSSVVPRTRRRRYVSEDMTALLDYHNLVRSQVIPTASDMEFMVWDEKLAKSAESWASRCVWDHGPPHILGYTGQNLFAGTGRNKSVVDMAKAWNREKNSFVYPHTCTGKVCAHYTQMVWAITNKIGCAIKVCSTMYVFGNTWKDATFLICNYSIKGNLVGEAPYKKGKPCSACPPAYGGSCYGKQCSTLKTRQ